MLHSFKRTWNKILGSNAYHILDFLYVNDYINWWAHIGYQVQNNPFHHHQLLTVSGYVASSFCFFWISLLTHPQSYWLDPSNFISHRLLLLSTSYLTAFFSYRPPILSLINLIVVLVASHYQHRYVEPLNFLCLWFNPSIHRLEYRVLTHRLSSSRLLRNNFPFPSTIPPNHNYFLNQITTASTTSCVFNHQKFLQKGDALFRAFYRRS